jgi:hypothetical protein
MNKSSMPSPQERESALFALAVEKPLAERSAFLQAVCGTDSALRQRLEALLAAHDQPENALATATRAVKATIKLNLADEPPDEAVGQTLGRYKLLEQIGEGGCGMVYVAEQKEPQRPSTQLTQALVAAEVTRRTSGGAEESAFSCRKIRRERCLESVG